MIFSAWDLDPSTTLLGSFLYSFLTMLL